MLARRPMLCFAFAIMLGSVGVHFFPDAPGVLLAWGWPLAGALLLWFAVTPRPSVTEPVALPEAYARRVVPIPGAIARRGLDRFIVILSLIFLLVGVWRHEAWTRRLAADHLPRAIWFDAVVLAQAPSRDYPGEKGGWRIPALLLEADGAPAGNVPVRLSGPDGPVFRRGDLLRLRVRREIARPPIFPGAFDYRFWLERNGLAGSLAVAARTGGSTAASYAVVPLDNVPLFTDARRFVDAVRARAIAATLDWGGTEGGMLAAMLYGYRRDVDEELRGAFRRVGIGHVLAISGLHIGLFVGLLWWLGGCIGWPARWRAILCLLMTLFYLGLSGGQVAASRAALMACIHLGGIARGRKSDMLNSLGAAAFILTLINPYSPLDVGFQLSFSAVVFICMALGREPDRNAAVSPKPAFARRWRRWLNEASSLVRMSLATWFGLFPIIAMVFNQANPAGIPINVVVIPLMSLVLAGGLLLPCLGWLPGAAWFLCLPAQALTVLARWVDGIPGASFPVNAPAPAWVAAFYCFLCLPLFRGMLRPGRFRRRAGMAAVAGMALSFAGMIASMVSLPPPSGGRIAVLPGGGVETVVAESSEGGMAMVGGLARNGRIAADWLRVLRRSGAVGVVATGRRGGDLSALSWQYPVAAATSAMAGNAGEGGEGWLPVPGAPGVEYAISRDAGGVLAWFAVRTGGKSVCVVPAPTEAMLAGWPERSGAGYDAELMLIGAMRNGLRAPARAMPAGLVLYGGRRDAALPPGWLWRNEFGAVELFEGIRGFDGKEWRVLRR